MDLPVIGIVKRDYEDSKVYITPTMKEIEELMEVKPEIIALDATFDLKPGGKTLDGFTGKSGPHIRTSFLWRIVPRWRKRFTQMNLDSIS